MNTEEKIAALIAFAEDHPDGFTHNEAEDALGWEHWEFERILPLARDVLAHEVRGLPCTPNGWGMPWLYQLTAEQVPVRIWTDVRIAHSERDLQSQCATWRSLVNATPANTMLGLAVRHVYTQYVRLLEDVAFVRQAAAI